jgi:hydroxymethylglutaryl-CoA reductase (NADPH)
MVSVPSFLLRRLYVRGTLKNTGQGLQFQLRNGLGSGYAEEMLPVTVDGAELPLAWCTFAVDGQVRPFSEVSREHPLTLPLNRDALVTVRNVTLTPELHTVAMGFRVPGLGALRFDFTDSPAPTASPVPQDEPAI